MALCRNSTETMHYLRSASLFYLTYSGSCCRWQSGCCVGCPDQSVGGPASCARSNCAVAANDILSDTGRPHGSCLYILCTSGSQTQNVGNLGSDFQTVRLFETIRLRGRSTSQGCCTLESTPIGAIQFAQDMLLIGMSCNHIGNTSRSTNPTDDREGNAFHRRLSFENDNNLK